MRRLVAILAVLLLSAAAFGQVGDEPPAPPGPSSPTIEWLQAQIDRLAGAAEPDEATRTSISKIYSDAKDKLTRAQELAAQAAEFKRLADEAPRELESVRAELATPAEPPAVQAAPDATLAQLEQEATQAKANLGVAREQADALRTETTRRDERRKDIPDAVARLRQRVQTLDSQIASAGVPATDEARARMALLVADREATRREADALDAELGNYGARSDLLKAKIEKAQRQVTRAETVSSAWDDLVAARRKAEAEATAREAKRLRVEAARRHPALAAFAEENEDFADARTGTDGVTAKIAKARTETDTAQKTSTLLIKEKGETLSKIAETEWSRATGLILIRRAQTLPNENDLRDRLRQTRASLEKAQIALVVYQERLRDAEDVDTRVRELLSSVTSKPEEASTEELQSVATELVTSRRELLTLLVKDYDDYSTALLDLERSLSILLDETEDFRSFIEERIFWTRSVIGPTTPQPGPAIDAARWLFDPAAWSRGLSAVQREAWSRPARTLLLTLLVLVLGLAFVWARRETSRVADLVSRYRTDKFRYTLEAAVLLVPLAGFLPGLVLIVGQALLWPIDQPEQVQATAHGMIRASLALLQIEVLRHTIRARGLSEAHFRWPAPGLARVRRTLLAVEPVVVVLSVCSWAMELQSSTAWSESLGRILFVTNMVIVTWLLGYLVRPSGPLLAGFFEHRQTGLIFRARMVWLPVVVAIPLMLGVLAWAGYSYTARAMVPRLGETFLMITALSIINGVAMRWLFVARRRLAIEEAKRKRLHAEAEGEEEETRSAPAIDEEKVDVPLISARTQLLFQNLVFVGVIVGLVTIWSDVLPALRVLDRVQVWPSVRMLEESADVSTPLRPTPAPAQPADATDSDLGTPTMPGLPSVSRAAPTQDATVDSQPFSITLADLLSLAVIVAATVIILRHFPALVEIMILPRLPLDAGSRYALATILRYAIGFIGALVAFNAIGLSWSKVQWLAAALTFGLAFGLQEIFANFISGIIMLLERPVRVGDTVTVEGVTGTVMKIRMRATTIRDWDRKELVIPNKTFVTNQIINWTLSDTILRITLPVGVSYDSDVDRVRDTLMAAARRHTKILDDPRPVVYFRRFGDSTLDFELRYFVPTIDDLVPVTDELHHAITKAFREAGIEIAYPQRDLHLRTIDDPKVVETLRGPRAEPVQHAPLESDEVRS